MAYKIWTSYNSADTCRDADDIHTEELGYKNELEDAFIVANNYIKKYFLHKDTKLSKVSINEWQATDFCSYGSTIYVKKIKIT